MRLFRFVAVTAVTVGVLFGASFLYARFNDRITDLSGPVVLKSVQDLGRFDAASGNFEIIVDLKKVGALPDFISSRRVLFVAVGSVNCYVDFSALGAKTISISPDRRDVAISLPTPSFDKANLDNTRSHIYNVDSGLIEWMGDLFKEDRSLEQQAYVAGEQKITEAAKAAGLQGRAEENTRRTLTSMLNALGFQAVTVSFAAPE